MKRTLALLIILGFLPSSAVVLAAEQELQVVRIPERQRVKLNMLPTRRVRQANMEARISFDAGQLRIAIDYKKMKPAVLFGGDVTCYVLWAVNRDGAVNNLGELWVRPGKESDTHQFATGFRTFALMVTGESYSQVTQPSEMLMFWNAASSDPRAPSEGLMFSNFGPAPAAGLETLEFVQYDGKTPLDVQQAEKVLMIAKEKGAEKYAAELYQEAAVRLAQAQQQAQSSRSRKGSQDFARRSVASANEAIRITLRRIEAEELEAEIAQRRQEMMDMEQRAAEAESEARRIREESERNINRLQTERKEAETQIANLRSQQENIEGTLRSMRSELEGLEADRNRLQTQTEQLSQQNEEVISQNEMLQSRLQGALSQVADTRDSARGLIVNLPDILFDLNQATLKSGTKIVLAKMAGILLLMSDLKLTIEGHTDSTGSAEYNLTLSEKRAQSVLDFMQEQGIAAERMTAQGFGLERPIADNGTAEGRRKNRRVEIVIGGTGQAADSSEN